MVPSRMLVSGAQQRRGLSVIVVAYAHAGIVNPDDSFFNFCVKQLHAHILEQVSAGTAHAKTVFEAIASRSKLLVMCVMP